MSVRNGGVPEFHKDSGTLAGSFSSDSLVNTC